MSTRIYHTHDTEENWSKIPQFIPKKGETIIYDADDKCSYERFKIGDGVTPLSLLPFSVNEVLKTFLEFNGSNCYADAGRITDYE